MLIWFFLIYYADSEKNIPFWNHHEILIWRLRISYWHTVVYNGLCVNSMGASRKQPVVRRLRRCCSKAGIKCSAFAIHIRRCLISVDQKWKFPDRFIHFYQPLVFEALIIQVERVKFFAVIQVEVAKNFHIENSSACSKTTVSNEAIFCRYDLRHFNKFFIDKEL